MPSELANEVWNGVTVEPRLSPNYASRPAADRDNVSVLVLHADADPSVADAIAYVDSDPSDVSYHVIVGRTGHAYLIVPLEYTAWAVGVSEFPQATTITKHGTESINDRSISLCFSNKNDGHEPYSDAQYAVGAKLAAYIIRRFPKITLARITTHALTARPVGRKTDPLGFDLDRFKNLVREELTQC